MSESLNRDTYMQLVKGIASARKMTEGEVRGLLDAGPYSAEEALRVGLVDELAYADQISERVPQIHDDGDETQRIDASEYGRVDPSSVGIRTRSRIAVIYAVGAITSGESGFDNVNGARVGSGTLVEQIRRVREDESFRAVVLRIDSPGGSSVASDVIWRELALMRDARPRRPLIVSMSDLAASGGYYIAMAGDVLVAQPATLTGSIGVYTGKMVVDGTLDKIGVGVETVQSGPNANIDSPFDQFTPAQRAKVQSYIQSFYDNFIEKAATARHMTPEQVDALARGRVWTGQQAHERGLVDELGGLAEAIAIAKERAKIPADEDVEIVAYPPPRSLYETLTEQFGGQAGINVWSLWLGNAEARALAALTAPVRLFRRGEPLALMPFTFVR
jgi:protease-4